MKTSARRWQKILAEGPKALTPTPTAAITLASQFPMSANRPVSDDELNRLSRRIAQRFDSVRDLLADKTADSDTQA